MLRIISLGPITPITVSGASVSLTVNAEATHAQLRVTSASMRYRMDGVAATTDTGTPLLINDTLSFMDEDINYRESLKNFRCINASGNSTPHATLFSEFFKFVESPSGIADYQKGVLNPIRRYVYLPQGSGHTQSV